MSDIKDGGPAFPIITDGDPCINVVHSGMTLRDYFAAKAMQKYMRDGGSYSEEDAKIIARYSYAQADAMIKERDK